LENIRVPGAAARRAARLMHVDPVVCARAIVADCLARGADAVSREAEPPVAPRNRRAAVRKLGEREVVLGFACILFSACLIFYSLIPR
jgi:hypothetical protein